MNKFCKHYCFIIKFLPIKPQLTFYVISINKFFVLLFIFSYFILMSENLHSLSNTFEKYFATSINTSVNYCLSLWKNICTQQMLDIFDILYFNANMFLIYLSKNPFSLLFFSSRFKRTVINLLSDNEKLKIKQ